MTSPNLTPLSLAKTSTQFTTEPSTLQSKERHQPETTSTTASERHQPETTLTTASPFDLTTEEDIKVPRPQVI